MRQYVQVQKNERQTLLEMVLKNVYDCMLSVSNHNCNFLHELRTMVEENSLVKAEKVT